MAALDRETGETLWEAGEVGTVGLVGLPYVVANGVIVVARDDALVGLRATSGQVLYVREGTVTDVLTDSDPDGLFATDGETIVSYDPLTGATRWTAALEGGGDVLLSAGRDLVCAERLVSPLTASRVTCYDSSDGSVRWSRLIHPPPWIAITGTRVVVAGLELGEGSGWMGLDPETGETVWKNAGLSGNGPAIARQGDALYACARECIAVRVSDGGVLWRRSLDQEVGSPAIGGESIFVVGFLSAQNPLYILDNSSGVLRDQIVPDSTEPSGFCGTPATSGDLLFVFGCRGTLYAYRQPQ